MNAGLRAQLGSELEPRGWDPANYEKLLDFLLKYAKENQARPVKRPMAIFDADNTTWTGDVNDATFVYLAKNLKLSARLHELLPTAIDVPASGYGFRARGRLFAAARARESLSLMLDAYREAMAQGAGMTDFLSAFAEDWVLPGGPLSDNTRFLNAYATYQGTLLATYNLLEEAPGRVAFDFSDVRVVTALYPDITRDFYAWETREGPKRLARFARPAEGGRVDILFPRILDTGADQPARRVAGELGSYTQITTWIALDKSPEELRRIALEVWDNSPGIDVPYAVTFPVDAASAAAPRQIDFSVERSRFEPGASPSDGIVIGTTSMDYGTRVREEIVNLMAVMARHDITPVVVSASQVDLVESVLQRAYRSGESPVAGMLHRLYEGLFGAHLLAPVTFRPGKVDAVRAIARRLSGSEDTRPVFCAGDSDTDLEFVAYSSDYRLFFDRKKELLMSLASYLSSHGEARTTLIQQPFE